MDIKSILSPERTCCTLVAASKKKAIEEAARQIADTRDDISAESIFESLINREKIGTTAIGHGIAIPHCRIDCEHVIGSLFRLEHPVDFDSFDDEPVQVLFVLLVPTDHTEEHLQTLGMLARRFESPDYRQALLRARGDEELFKVAVSDIPESGTG